MIITNAWNGKRGAAFRAYNARSQVGCGSWRGVTKKISRIVYGLVLNVVLQDLVRTFGTDVQDLVPTFAFVHARACVESDFRRSRPLQRRSACESDDNLGTCRWRDELTPTINAGKGNRRLLIINY